tara:strand:+ start:1133 stop:1267 length:135 start_codon:yes stop_codon:yes gene_type:complete
VGEQRLRWIRLLQAMDMAELKHNRESQTRKRSDSAMSDKGERDA